MVVGVREGARLSGKRRGKCGSSDRGGNLLSALLFAAAALSRIGGVGLCMIHGAKRHKRSIGELL